MIEMALITDALETLKRHPALLKVGEPKTVKNGLEVEVTVSVSLPSRFAPLGKAANGVKSEEDCALIFPLNWPMQAPKVWLREDFPRNLPHINPGAVGEKVNPCLFEGSLDEVLHRFGLERIIDQLSEWLTKAACGQLIDLEHGWEPTRRDSAPSTVVFSADEVIAKVPMDGSLLMVTGKYFADADSLFAIADENLNGIDQPVFNQKQFVNRSQKFTEGQLPIIFARGVDSYGSPLVVSHYTQETVGSLEDLIERAKPLGIHTDELHAALKKYALEFSLKTGGTQETLAVVVLLVHRPVGLVGAPRRRVEILPYAIRFSGTFTNIESKTHPAFHSHRVSPALLSLASGIKLEKTHPRLVILGCGSLGSKVALHLGRAGIGNMVFIDNESISPHNGARHALIPPRNMTLFNPNKATLMEQAFRELGHTDCDSLCIDATETLLNESEADSIFGDGNVVIVETTAALRVSSAAVLSTSLTGSQKRRLVQAGLYGQGKVAFLFAEGTARSVTADDLKARLFERCRNDSYLRQLLSNDSTDATRLFVGENCRSLTMPMTDSTVSRAASLVGKQLENWLVNYFPVSGQLCLGLEDESGIGMKWQHEELKPTVVLLSTETNDWNVRVLASVVEEIDANAKCWLPSETGGALIGNVSFITRTIVVAGTIDAPDDSARSPTEFTLGINGHQAALETANAHSLGHLHFIGTWHSHPMGGKHSAIDKRTLSKIAKNFEGVPAISLVWSPDGLKVEVKQELLSQD